MSRRSTRISLLLAVLLSSEAFAIGLGDIRQDSALNEPLRADIVLLGATADEIAGLKVQLGSSDDFARYGIDRPFFLQEIEFNVVNRGVDDSIVQVRSRSPIAEPFVTFLVEATWPGGRLLREYTLLLDPPTYTPPGAQQAPAVQAPVRQSPSDSAPIQRRQPPPPPASQPSAQPAPQPSQPPRTSTPSTSQSQPSYDDFDTTGGGQVTVSRGDTLWGIASRMRPDNRLTMNQTMLAIYEANRSSFDGNINRLRAGASLRIPSADEVFRINRGDAFSEVRRQNAAWDSGTPTVDSGVDDVVDTTDDTDTRPSLTLVPPDEEQDSTVYDDTASYEPYSREQEIEDRIAVLEAEDLAGQPSLIEIRDNELAALRQELAEIRGEVYEPPVDETVDESMDEEPSDEVFADDEEVSPDTDVLFPDADDLDAAEDDLSADETGDEVQTPTRTTADDEGIVATVLGFLKSFWMWIAGGVLALIALLVWFARRGDGGDEYATDRPWESLDGDADATQEVGTHTETMHAPSPDEAIVVVEQDSGIHPMDDGDTIEATSPDLEAPDTSDGTAQFGSLEDTFSSDTAVNLDQTDPIAEADFHMAYGLYDQAADLINGALETDPDDKNLMSKLCEIFFVWGNRDSFVEAASRLKTAVGEAGGAEWDKIVIMGQQIAADHEMFAGAEVAAATEAVDLSFEDGGSDTGVLDMDFGGDSGDSNVVDLGADGETAQDVDFMFDEAGESSVDVALESTAESPTIESDLSSDTAESPTIESELGNDTAEMPVAAEDSSTIAEQIGDPLEGTSELPSIDADIGQAIVDSGRDSDATAEINVDELDLNIGDDDATELASLDDLDETGTNEELDEIDSTGKNPEVDPNETGVREALAGSGIGDDLDIDDLIDTGTSETGLHLAADETGQTPGIDESLLDATGMTQVLTDDMAVDTGTAEDLAGDAETLLAPVDDDDDDFDFAKTEALPPDAYTGNTDLDDTAETPAIAGTDVDLDLDDLTEALKVSEAGDTVEQVRDDATVEQPRPPSPDETAAIPTMSLGPNEMSDDLNEARTMTEVGTKLDLARAYVDMGDPAGARSILEEVLDEGDEAQKQQAQQLLDSLPS